MTTKRAKTRGELQEVELEEEELENNARGEARVDSVDGAVASDRARVASPEPSALSLRCEVVDDARANETVSLTSNAGATLFESAGSPADAVVAPPDSAAPPHEGKALHPDVPAVVRALGRGVARHGGKAVKTAAWEQPIDLLLRRGPTEWLDPEPVPVAEILTVIRWLFDGGTVKRGTFCWADQVQSGSALRRYWVRLRAESRDTPPLQLTTVPGGRRREDPAVQAEREMRELQAEWEAGKITPESLFPRQARLAREEAARRAARSA